MATLEVEGRRFESRPSRSTGYVPVYATRTINHPSDINVVATRLLAPALERVIAEANADMGEDESSVGGLAAVCERAETWTGTPPASIARRVYEIRLCKSRATKASTADALLMAGNSSLRDEGIPEVPAGMPAAVDRVRCSLELLGREMSEDDIAELAEDLLEFARCVIHGPGEELEPQVTDIVAVLEGEIGEAQLGLWDEAA